METEGSFSYHSHRPMSPQLEATQYSVTNVKTV